MYLMFALSYEGTAPLQQICAFIELHEISRLFRFFSLHNRKLGIRVRLRNVQRRLVNLMNFEKKLFS